MNDDLDLLAGAINQLLARVDEQGGPPGPSYPVPGHGESLYRRLQEDIPGMVFIFALHTDGTRSFQYCNSSSLAMFGVSPEDVLRDANRIMQLIHPDDRERFDAAIERSAETLQPLREVLRYEVNGEVRWYDCVSRPERQPSGEILWLGMYLEVTEHMNALESLKRALRSLTNSQKLAKVGNWDWDVQQGKVEWSNEVYRIFDLDPETFRPQIDSVMNRFHPDDRLLHESLIQQAIISNHEQYAFEARILSANDETRYLLSTSEGRFDDRGELVQISGTVQDITEQKRAEEELRQAKAYSEKLIESANAMIVVLDAEHRIQVFNHAAEEITGYSAGEVKGRDWFDTLVPRDKYPEVWDVFHTSIPRTFENTVLTKAGEERFISWRNTRLVEDDTFAGSLFYGIDITARTQLERQLLQSQKMEAVGQLAGGVAHDFNNMLAVILGHAELIKFDLPADHPLLSSVLEIEKAGLRSRDVTRQLLAFSRKQIIVPRNLDLNRLILDLTQTLSRLIGENVRLRVAPAEDLWTVNCDPSQIDQILINLAVNSRDAMPHGGTLSIQTYNEHFDDGSGGEDLNGRPGSFVVLEVTDDGMGMDEELLARIFEPFFTTKEIGKGTGLGLATVYGIVKQNDGMIRVQSEPANGTTFKVFIPRILEQDREDQQTETAPSAFRPVAILLVEDDEMVRRTTTSILERFGHSVVTMGTPMKALRFLEQGAREVDLLIIDVVMPQMSGTSFYNEALSLRPGLKALFISGYTDDVIDHHGVIEDMSFLQKPFTMKQLEQGIRAALERE